TFRLLARPGAKSRLVLPASIPAGMVPVTSSETGQVAFLVDRRPWSIRRFLLALQKSWSALPEDPRAACRIHRSTLLRAVQLPARSACFPALIALLSAPSAQARLEETFWIDGSDAAARSEAFEIASTILTANTGLRDTGLSLPTVAEAQRLWREGRWFALE